MTLKLALVIDGDPAGAKKALAETASAVEDLSKKTEAANRTAGSASSAWGDVAGKAGDASRSIGEAARESGGLAGGLGSVAIEGAKAAPEIEKAGTAAGGAFTGFSNLRGAVSGVAISFAAGLGTGLLVSAFDTVIGKASEFARQVLTDGPRIESDLKSHAALVRDIKAAYSEADGAASSYGSKSGALLKFNAQQDEKRLQRDYEDAVPEFRIGGGGGRSGGAGAANLGPYAAVVKLLNEGKIKAIEFQQEVAKIASALPKDSPFRATAEGLIDATDEAVKLQTELQRTGDILKGLDGDAQAAATALGGAADKYGQIGSNASAAGPALDGAASGITATGDAAGAALSRLNAYNAALARTPSDGAGALPSPRPFAAGGYTGDFDTAAAVGVVHGKEFVFDAVSTARIGVPALEAMRRGVKGYADGGFVGVMPAAASGAAVSGGSIITAAADDFNALHGAVTRLADAAAEGSGEVSSFSDRLQEGLDELWQSLLDEFLNIMKGELTKGLQQLFSGAGTGGGGWGSLLADLFGGGAISPVLSGVISGGGGGLFNSGGWTGPGGKFDPRGIVHADEYVFTKEETNSIGVSNLAALAKASRTGFAGGGFAGTPAPAGQMAFGTARPQITFVNNGTPQKVTAEREEDDGKGGRRTVYELDDAVAANLARPGSSSGKALRSAFGAQRQTVMR